MPDAQPPLVARPTLLERERELVVLTELVAGLRAGQGMLVLVEGPAGIGKTGLLTAVRDVAATAGVDVLRARGSELEREFPYGMVRQLFEPRLASAAPDERAELLGGAGALAARLFDEDALANSDAAGSDVTFAALHGLFWLTANLAADSPLLLVLDDLHWADAASLRWLAYLGRRLEGLPVLVVAGLRPGEPGADAALLTELASDPDAVVLRPAALSREAVALLVRGDLGPDADDAFCDACYEASSGNPLLLQQLVGALQAEGVQPRDSEAHRVREIGAGAVSRFVQLRLMRLPPTATALARAVAVLGDGVDLARAAGLAGLDHADAADAAGLLSRIGIFRREMPLGFAHPLVRSAVYDDLSGADRQNAHDRAARLLSSSGATAEEIAAHLLLVPQAGARAVVETLRGAAQRAVTRGAPENAATYLRRALAEPPGDDVAEVLHELGSAEARVAAPEALEHLDAARAATSDVRTRALIALELAGPHLSTRLPRDKAVEILEETIEELADEDSTLSLELENQIVGIARFQPDLHPVAGPRLERLRALAPRLRDGHLVLATLATESARAGTSRAEALELAERALAGGKLMREQFDPAFIFAAGVLTASDRLDAASRLYGEALEDARRRGLIAQFCIASCFRSVVAIHRGALADAVADAESCLGVLEANRLEIVRPAAAGFLAIALTEQGDLEAAGDVLSSAGVSDTDINAYVDAWFFDARARLLLAAGDANRALDGFLSLGRYLEGIGVRNPALLAWRSPAALALLRLGRSDEARRYADEELALSRQWGAPRAVGKSLIAAGLAHEGADGLALLREAAAVLESSEARLEHARALIELGSALRRANRRSDSREPLRQGLELATRCGAGRLAEHAKTELLATGARPRRIALSGIDSLTPSERRVAEFAAAGSTNREIAQALFVTAKTVELHLSSTYRKLAISSRSQLRAALEAPAAAPDLALGA